MRRESIYPHRSIRALPISRPRLLAALLTAALLCSGVVYIGTPLMEIHDSISAAILKITGTPSLGVKTVDIFPGLGPVTAPDIPIPHHRANPMRTVFLFAVSLVGLIIVYRSIPLSRNFIIFLLILLFAAGFVMVLNPSFYFDSAMYQQIWLRGEILVWILLPWVSAFLFLLTLPSLAGGIGWALLLQVYAVLWSALRLAFCLGVLHYTGILFLPLLWFCLGVLFDLVYVLTFYSFALKLSLRKVVGERRP
jgi:hypothetical protein